MKHEVDMSAAIAATKEKKVLNKPFRTPSGPKKFSVYVKNDKGNIVKVNFGDPNMEIKRDDPNRRSNYRARHHCESPGPKWKANYWSCKMWSKTPVSKMTSSAAESENEHYMFFSNLKTMKRIIDELLALDEKKVDAILMDGHDWACDHVAVSKDNLVQVHNFLMNKDSSEASAKTGLWENIQKKKERMGDNYKPAKPGQEGYPDKKAFEKAQGEEFVPNNEHTGHSDVTLNQLSDYYTEKVTNPHTDEDWDGETFYRHDELIKTMPELVNSEVSYEDEIVLNKTGKEYPYDAPANPERAKEQQGHHKEA